MTDTIISRLQLAHPDLGTAGGSSLHAEIAAIYTKLGDAVDSRYFTQTGLANAASVDFEHNFATAFANLRYDLYTVSGGLLTLISDLTNWSIIATPSFTTTKIRVTNNTGGSLDIALVVQDDPIPLREIQDVDVTTTAPQDGQALVYELSSLKWKPGASGDSSFKAQAVATPNLSLKGGYIITPSGIEYATYSGSGTIKTSYGVDLTLNLTTILGGSPANATTYALCIDRTLVSAPATLTDNGRKLVQITQSHFVLLTTALTAIDKSRYIPLLFVKSATTGNVWSGSGADFGTFATRTADPVANLKYNLYVHPTIVAPNYYATLALALAAASAGDRILVLGSYTITSVETISLSDILVEFLPNVKITINAAIKGLTISGNDVQLIRPQYISAFVGTVTAGIEISGNDCNVERAKVESNNAGTTITDAFLISGAMNRITGIAKATLGAITNTITDNGSSSDFNVRS